MRTRTCAHFPWRVLGGLVAVVWVGTASGSAILLTGGTLNEQVLSPSAWEIEVQPGAPISGNLLMQVEATGTGPSVVFPLGYTWTWGVRETSMVLLSRDAPFGVSNWNVSIDLTAPSSAGSYYILFGLRGEYTLSQVFSCTNWTAGGDLWQDGNDYHDMVDTDLLLAHELGFIPEWPVWLGSGYALWPQAVAVMPVRVNVCPPPACIGDIDGDGHVAVVDDLVVLLAAWGSSSSGLCNHADLDGDGVVGVTDLLMMLKNWGACPE